MKRFPITIAIAAIAILANAFPSLAGWLQLDFAQVGDGQWWRIWTGHLTHYDGNHLLWDLIMFLALGAACESKHPKQFLGGILVMTAVISAAIGLCCEQILVYRGLSGLDTGLFTWLAVDQIREAVRQRDRLAAWLWLTPSIGLIAKLVYEYVTGTTLFVDSSDFIPLVQSHLAGAALGCGIGMGLARIQHRLSQRGRQFPPPRHASE